MTNILTNKVQQKVHCDAGNKGYECGGKCDPPGHAKNLFYRGGITELGFCVWREGIFRRERN